MGICDGPNRRYKAEEDFEEKYVHSIVLPFSGFYESWHSWVIEDAVEFCTQDSNGDQLGGLLSETFWEHVDYPNVYMLYAQMYTEDFADAFNLDLKFEELNSPTFYNFATDRIFARTTNEQVQKMFNTIRDTDLLEQVAEAMFTSRSDFISHYNPNIKTWDIDPMEWDHNQLNTLLEAYLEHTLGETFEDSRWEADYASGELNANGHIDNMIFDKVSPELDRLSKIACYLREREDREYHRVKADRERNG